MARFAFRHRSGTSAPAKAGCAGRAFLLLFGLFFFGMGSAFMVFLARDTWNNWQTRSWRPVHSTIVESSVRNENRDKNPYRPEIRYRASAGADQRVYDTWRRTNAAFDDYAKAQAVVDRYPVGSTVTAYVDPNDPTRAVLEHTSPWFGLFVFFPLIFVLVGLGIMIAAVKAKFDTAADERALSERPTVGRGLGRGCGVGFFALFFLAGSGLLIPFAILPALRLASAQNWPAVECTIVSSRVREVRGDESTTYKPDILYRYTFNGREYQSSRHSPYGMSSGNRRSASEIVRRHRAGRTATCYVNPSDPGQAYLSREFQLMPTLLSVIPLVFVLVGAGGLVFLLRQGRAHASPVASLSAAATRGPLAPLRPPRRGPITLRPKIRPWMKVAGFALIALFWNGIVSIFVVEVVEDWARGRADMCMTAFMIPFVLIGLGLIAGLIHSFLALFNPMPEVTIEKASLTLGDTVEVKWRFTGNVHRVHRLHITLEGREEATYRRGTDTVTDKHVFHRATVAETSRQMEIATGNARLSIPAGTMHSFASSSNKIAWELCLHGEIEGWPDVKLEFGLDIEPLPLTGGRA